jgi:gamma-glutamyl phosphate reductase
VEACGILRSSQKRSIIMAMNPDQQKALQSDREAMPTDVRQAVALETIADRLQLTNEKLTSLLHHVAAISRRG